MSEQAAPNRVPTLIEKVGAWIGESGDLHRTEILAKLASALKISVDLQLGDASRLAETFYGVPLTLPVAEKPNIKLPDLDSVIPPFSVLIPGGDASKVRAIVTQLDGIARPDLAQRGLTAIMTNPQDRDVYEVHRETAGDYSSTKGITFLKPDKLAEFPTQIRDTTRVDTVLLELCLSLR